MENDGLGAQGVRSLHKGGSGSARAGASIAVSQHRAGGACV